MLNWFVLMLAQSFAMGVQPITVSGEVLSLEGEPVPLAQVALVAEPPFGKGETVYLQTRCNERGQFRFQLPRPMNMAAFVLARQKGYGLGWTKIALTNSAKCVIRLNRPAILSGKLFPPSPQRCLTVKSLRPLGLFNLKLLPFQLRDVSLDFLQAQTDENGNFALNDLPENCVAILELNEPPCRFELPILEGLTLTLPPTCLIVGRVVRRSDGEPLEKSEVVLKPVANLHENSLLKATPIEIRTFTDAKGQFQANVPEGEWLIWLPAKGDAEWVSIPQVLKLKANEVKTVTVQAQRPAIVRGWVADVKTRFPITSLFVHAQLIKSANYPSPKFPIFSEVAQQLPEGAYELRLPDGVWELKVADEGWESESVVAELVEGAVLEAPWIFVRPFAKVKVFVADEHGRPTKALLADSDGKIGETDEKGFAEWQVPSERKILLVASSIDRNFWASMSLTAEQSEGMLKLREGVKISGIVVNASGQTEADALVTLLAKFQSQNQAICLLSERTSFNGRFQFTVPSDASIQLQVLKGGKFVQTGWVAPQSFGFVKLVLK
ncbi:MAG: hypothetical protein NZ805_14245 [Armatimonadetes bacterium]|nr:hypothetical protein [Armatimonadota bacterium]MDW8028576.1 hypothetical protein [Armatimonadota bacterium]